MSIKAKIILIFISCVTVVLILSNTLYYVGAQTQLINLQRDDMEKQTLQIKGTLAQQQEANKYVENLLSDRLRMASIAAEGWLPHDIKHVTNEQLVSIAQKLGVSQITLLIPTADHSQFVAAKSSEEKELGITTASWGYWNPVLLQLFAMKPVTAPHGITKQNYWSGPLATASTDQNTDFFGYYYDGTTNYIIDPFLKNNKISDFITLTGINPILSNYVNDLEIAGLSVRTFGRPPIYTPGTNGVNYVDRNNQPVLFGSYTYKDTSDVASFNKAIQTKQPVLVITNDNGKKVLKEFISVTTGGNGDDYVMELVRDYNDVQGVLDGYLRYTIYISLILLLACVAMSFWLTAYIERPIRKIMGKIKNISKIQFSDAPISVHRNDEIGRLASGVNELSSNLHAYASGLQSSLVVERSSAMALLGTISSGLLPELRNPVNEMQTAMEALPSLVNADENTKLSKIMTHMVMANEHMDKIVRDFTDFISQGKVDLKPHDVTSVAREAVELVRSVASSHSVTIECDLPASPLLALIDDTKMRQVLINLMKNGAEATATCERKEVRLHVFAVKQSVIIDVSDTGIGIPEDKWNTLFNAMKTTKEHGLGFGLMLSNYIVRSNGGTIAVHDSSGEGTTMRIVLPAYIEEVEPKDQPEKRIKSRLFAQKASM